MTMHSGSQTEMFSVTEAARWLKAQGVRSASRHAIYVALASGRLKLAGSVRRVMLIRRTDVERFARELSENPGARC